MSASLLVLFTIFWSVDGQIWMTQYDLHFQFACPTGQTIKSLASIHDNYYEDRIWNFTCVAPPHGVQLSNCEWSGYVNDFDQLVEYQCPSESIICGIESVHENYYEDRKWSFLCCVPEDYMAHACQYTPYVNTYDNVLNYRVPDDFVLRGVDSVHDNDHEDRILKFDICQLDHIGETEGVAVG